ncbi:GNAT family N-acetyltransferase [Antarcticimicrobium luteum]|nr:GNAT family N-acetyltransferase [Antarcticimicrobium luteum]
MHVIAEARGRGAGAAMLEHLLAQAADMGLSRVSLETGSGPDFAPARRLYGQRGFVECPPFGDYLPDPHSTFMTRPCPGPA